MNKYKYSKWSVSCSFCGKSGHNIRSCPEVPIAAKDDAYKNYDAFRVAIAQGEMTRRINIRLNRSQKKRKKPHCGFCSARKHNRKNCPKLKKVSKLLYKANMRWRKEFVQRVNDLGVGQGALIQVKGLPERLIINTDPLARPKYIGVVEPFDFESLNVFCSFLGHWDYRSEGSIKAKVTTKKGFVDINLGKYIGEDLFYKNSFLRPYSSVTVVSPAKWQPPTGWIEEKEIPPLDWLLKTHNAEDIKDFNIDTFIDKWT